MSLDPLTLAANTDFANWKAGKAGNDGTYPKWPLLEAEFVGLMDCNSEQVRVKWVADNNSRVRMNEVPMTEGAVYAILVCAANNNFASRTFDEVPKQYVGDGSIEGVLLLRQTANGQPNDIEPWKVVALEHSLLKQRSAEVWPSVPNVDVPDPNSLRFAIRSIGELQQTYTKDYWNPNMQKRKEHAETLAIALAARLNSRPDRAALIVDQHAGQGGAIKTPYVRIYDPQISPNAQTGVYVCMFVSADGSLMLLSVQSGATVWRDGNYRSLPKAMLDSRSDEYFDLLVGNPETGQLVNRHNASREFPIEGSAGEVGGRISIFKRSNIACSVIPISELPSDTQIRDQVRDFVAMADYLNSSTMTPINFDIESGISLITKNIHWPERRVAEVLESLRDKSPQVVLAGPPGTGKTFVARWFAAELLGTPGELDNDQITIVQFHPTYGYEDFVEGLRPVEKNGAVVFEPVPGPILKLSQEIHEDDAPQVLIIDEINRANIPRVFGELMYLLEYRDRKIDLMLQDGFSLPKGLFIIATMNTADKSTRVMDVALRRRFDFFSLDPDVEVLRAHYESGAANNEMGEELYDGFVKLNGALREDLDKHRLIGHSYFMDDEFSLNTLRARWDRQIAPLLDEYFFERKAVENKYTIEGFWPSAAT
jgi:MoxR-like ATPase